jgi:glutamine synthetase
MCIQAGSGAHVHISVHAQNEMPRPSTHPNLTDLEATFLAGVLDHLAALTLLILPTTTSYQRMMDGVWSGGTYICWGTDNREAPLRLCNAYSPSSRNFELKTLDGTANPYLALAGVLGAGFEGILESKELTIQDCSGSKPAALMGEKGRAELGIKERFPLTWEDARVKFEKSGMVDSLFGSDFKTKYLSVNKVFFSNLFFGFLFKFFVGVESSNDFWSHG